jgi:hypothetical protein
MVNSCWRFPASTQRDPVRRLANFAIALGLQSVAGCGDTLGLFSFAHGLPPKLQRGFCRQLLCSFRRFRLKTHIANAFQFVVWRLPMLTEFQLWVLSTMVMVALVFV